MKKSTQITLFSHVTFLDTLLFTKHLSVLLESGITIVESLQILSDQTKSAAFKTVLLDILHNIQNGNTLAKSLEKHAKIFSSFYISLIEVGEATGTLDQNLSYLSEQMTKEYAFKKKVKGALMYPMIVLSAAIVVGMGISLFALPKLVDLFKDFDVQLPLTTRVLLGFATLMQHDGILIGIGIVMFIFFFKWLTKVEGVKPLWHRILLGVPLFGKIIENAELTAFCRSLGIMLKSGLPITQALDIETKLSANVIFNNYARKLLLSVTKGKPLSEELETGKYPKIPLIAVKMIAVGEKTGKLDKTLLYLSNFFEDEVDDATKNISTLLEPVLLLVIGIIVAFVALAIISPIYQLTSSIKR